LRKRLEQDFNFDELKNLAFDLALDWQSIPHNNTTEFPRELITLCEREQLLPQLLRLVRKRKPGLVLTSTLEELAVSFGESGTLNCPYQGLDAFQEKDASFFFGRGKFSEQLVAAVQSRPLVVLVGASGSGKSSVVLAGLLPRLKRDSRQWVIISFRPGSQPFKNLAAALIPWLETELSETTQMLEVKLQSETLRNGQLNLAEVLARITAKHGLPRLLLVADQFEELYTLCQDEAERRAFMDVVVSLLASLPEPAAAKFSLVLTLRADFYGYALDYPPLASVLKASQLNLEPMNEVELTSAIEGPALRANLELEGGLTKRLVDAVRQRPGDLPLLQFALTRLWKRQQSQGKLTLAAYEAIGGVEKALTEFADSLFVKLDPKEQRPIAAADSEFEFVKLDPKEQALAQQIFIQLVQTDIGTLATRRVARRSELGEEKWKLIASKLAKTRLVVTNRDESSTQETVELAHEALIGNWQKLQEWLEVARQFRTWQEEVRSRQRQWQAKEQKDEGELLRGSVLTKASEYLTQRPDEIGSEEQTYIKASQALQEREQAERNRHEQDRIRREDRDRRQRRITLGLIIGLTMMLALASFAFFQFLSANSQFQEAQKQRQIAASINLASQAQVLYNSKPDLALLLSVEANKGLPDNPLVMSSLLNGLASSPGPKAFFRDHNSPVYAMAINSSGKTMASGSRDGNILLRDLTTNLTSTLSLKGHSETVRSLAFSPNGRFLASAGDDKKVILWDLNTAQPTSPPVPLTEHNDEVYSLTFSPDGNTLASASIDGTIILWDVTKASQLTPKTRFTVNDSIGGVYSITFSPDGRFLAFAGGKGKIMLWDIAKEEELDSGSPLIGHTGRVYSLAFSPDGKLLASGGIDRKVILWDLSTNPRQTKSLEGYSDVIYSLAFSPDGSTLASAGGDRSILLWDVNTYQKLLPPLTAHTDVISSVAFIGDNQHLASASLDGTIVIWEQTRQLLSKTLKGPREEITSVAFSQNGKLLASGGSDTNVFLWNVEAATSLQLPVSLGTNSVTSLAFSPDSEVLACANSDNTISLWDVKTGKEITPALQGYNGSVFSLVFSSDGKVLVSAGSDQLIYLWDLSKHELLTTLPHKHTGIIRSLAFSPKDKMLASGSEDKTVILWDIAECLKDMDKAKCQTLTTIPLTGHVREVFSVAFSPNGELLASGGNDRTIILWNATTHQQMQVLNENQSTIYSLAFNPDGKILATGNFDGTIKLWDVSSRQAIGQPLKLYSGRVLSVAFNPVTKASLASAGSDAKIVLSNFDPNFWQFTACQIANRNLSKPERQLYLLNEPYSEENCKNLL